MENSMLQRQEAEKKSVPSVGNSAMQLAKMMGNQAVVQMCTDWDSAEAWAVWNLFKHKCTQNFVRRHICGIRWAGEGPPTRVSRALVNRLHAAILAGTVPRDPDGVTVVFEGHHFCAYEDSNKIYHYGGTVRRR